MMRKNTSHTSKMEILLDIIRVKAPSWWYLLIRDRNVTAKVSGSERATCCSNSVWSTSRCKSGMIREDTCELCQVIGENFAIVLIHVLSEPILREIKRAEKAP